MPLINKTFETNTRTPLRWRLGAAFLALGLAATACGSDTDEAVSTAADDTATDEESVTEETSTDDAESDDAESDATAEDSTDDASSEGATPGADFAASAYTTDLSEVCPATVVIQIGWFPEPARGHLFQPIGDGGVVDVDSGSYSGPLGSTGVNLEIRAGGPYVGDQANTSLMYQDDDILLAELGTDETIDRFGAFPTIGVIAPIEVDPQIIMWDPEQFQIDSFDDIAATGAPLLVFGSDSAWVRYLVSEGLLLEEQVDESYDGSPSRFASSGGTVLQQGYAITEPYEYENVIEEWGKPVDSILIAESGFSTYANALAIRADKLEEARPCLEGLVPILQQAVVDYATDPTAVNNEMMRIVEELATFWELTPEGTAFASEQLVSLGLLSNGPDGTIGNFDPERVDALIDIVVPIFSEQNDDFDSSVTGEDVFTNEFIDPSIGLG